MRHTHGASTVGHRRKALIGGTVAAALAVGTVGLAAPAQAWTPSGLGTYTVTPGPNNALPQSCGLDVVLALDASFGVGPDAAAVKQTATDLIASFQDTNTRVGIVSFASTTHEDQPEWYRPLTLDTAAQQVVNNNPHTLAYTISKYTTGGNTNWESAWKLINKSFADGAAALPSRDVPKVVVFLSDGAPNWNDAMQATDPAPANDAYGRLDHTVVDNAVTLANTFKAASVKNHVLAVGIGSELVPVGGVLPDEGQRRLDMLKRISQYTSPEIVASETLTDPVAGVDFHAATTDVLLQADPTTVSAKLGQIATQVCGASLSVTQHGQSASSPTYAGQAGWNNTVSWTSGQATYTLPVGGSGTSVPTQASDAGGTTVYQWDAVNPIDPVVTIESHTNFGTPVVTCTVNNANPTTPALTPVTGGWSFPAPQVSAASKVDCDADYPWTGTRTTAVTLTPAAKYVTYGATKTLLTATLKDSYGNALAGKVVKFKARRTGTSTWVDLTTCTTALNGRCAKYVAPKTTWQYKATFSGATKLSPGGSGTTKLLVRYRVSGSVKVVGTKVTMTGAVLPNAKYKAVILQRWTGTKWVYVKSAKLSSTSTYRLTWTKPRAKYYYRVVKAGTGLYADKTRMLYEGWRKAYL